jgi:hypothetical protein
LFVFPFFFPNFLFLLLKIWTFLYMNILRYEDFWSLNTSIFDLFQIHIFLI